MDMACCDLLHCPENDRIPTSFTSGGNIDKSIDLDFVGHSNFRKLGTWKAPTNPSQKTNEIQLGVGVFQAWVSNKETYTAVSWCSQSAPQFQRLRDLQLRDQKVTLNHLRQTVKQIKWFNESILKKWQTVKQKFAQKHEEFHFKILKKKNKKNFTAKPRI